MLLSDEKQFDILLSTIYDYQEGVNDIPILMVQKICQQLIQSIDKPTDTQEIYDTVVDCFDFYNDFIKEKNVDLQPIEDGFYDLVELYINDIIKEMK